MCQCLPSNGVASQGGLHMQAGVLTGLRGSWLISMCTRQTQSCLLRQGRRRVTRKVCSGWLQAGDRRLDRPGTETGPPPHAPFSAK